VAEVEISIVGRSYRIACRDGEEDNLRRAAAMVDAKSREALAGLGTLSESRQLLFASLLLADQLIEGDSAKPPAPAVSETQAPAAPPVPPTREPVDSALVERTERLAQRLESLAARLEEEAAAS
jgi:cell division protein ZapA